MRTVQIGNVAGVFGLKRELPKEPENINPSSAEFIGTLQNYFGTKAMKFIATKICIGRNEYDNEIVCGTATDDVGIDEVSTEPKIKKPDKETCTNHF